MRWLSALQNTYPKIVTQIKKVRMYIAWLESGWQKLDLASYNSLSLTWQNYLLSSSSLCSENANFSLMQHLISCAAQELF